MSSTIKLGVAIQNAPAAVGSALVSTDRVAVSRNSDSLTLGMHWSQLEQTFPPLQPTDLPSAGFDVLWMCPQSGYADGAALASLPNVSDNTIAATAALTNVTVKTGLGSGVNMARFTGGAAYGSSPTGGATLKGGAYFAVIGQFQNTGAVQFIYALGDANFGFERAVLIRPDGHIWAWGVGSFVESGIVAEGTLTPHLIEVVVEPVNAPGPYVYTNGQYIFVDGVFNGVALQLSEGSTVSSFSSASISLGRSLPNDPYGGTDPIGYATFDLYAIGFQGSYPTALAMSTMRNAAIKAGVTLHGNAPVTVIGDSTGTVGILGGRIFRSVNNRYAKCTVNGPFAAESLVDIEHFFATRATNNVMELLNYNVGGFSALGVWQPGSAVNAGSNNENGSFFVGLGGPSSVFAPNGEMGTGIEFSFYGGATTAGSWSLVQTTTDASHTWCRQRIDRATQTIKWFATQDRAGNNYAAQQPPTWAAISISAYGEVIVQGGPVRTAPLLRLQNFRGSDSANVNAGNVGGRLFTHGVDTVTTAATTTFTDAYSDTVPANSFVVVNDSIEFEYLVKNKISATATRDAKVVFAGQTVLDSGSVAFTTAGDMILSGRIMSDSTNSFRVQAQVEFSGTTLTPVINDSTFGSIDFTSANIIKLSMLPAGLGSNPGDMTARMGVVDLMPAGN